MLLACSCICKLVSFGWSDPRSVGPKFLGFLNCSLGPGIFNYCPAGSVAEFVFFSGGLHSIHFFRHSDCIYIYSSGYIAVK
jgi:hypothetical protein